MAIGLDLSSGGLGFVVITFVIGLLLGVVVKRVLKLAVAIVALVIALVATGYVNFSLDKSRQETIYHAFSTATPSVVSTASQVATLLPISSAAFLIGISLGLWKG